MKSLQMLVEVENSKISFYSYDGDIDYMWYRL